MIHSTGVRQLGVQETSIVPAVRAWTKEALVADHNGALEDLKHLAALAMKPRKGPVWLDVPLDVQSSRC